jgi:hypothetical protein
MRRFLTLLTLLMVGSVFISSLVWAGTHAQLSQENVFWRTSTTSGDPNDQGFIDSSVVRSGPATQHADTTSPVSMLGWSVSQALEAGATDTTLFFIFALTPTTNTAFTAGADSIYLAAQVSWDGANWIGALVPTQLFDTAPIGTDVDSQLAQEVASSNCFSLPFRQTHGTLKSFTLPSGGLTTAPTPAQLFGYPLIRFIMSSDQTGEFQGRIYRFED